ncbi:MAG: glycan-binding surface protein [Dysgonamonadaceae bacterium]|nr:glycan-binding surface protein [Dysgonamonadaceae bacterium]
MKNIIYKTFFLLALVALVSCQEETPGKYKMTDGVPTIKYVRYSGNENPDRLLDGALMGENIVLVGDNFTSIKELYFNDQKASLNINFITANTLFTSVPTGVPQERTDKIWMVTGSGERVSYDFEVRIPAPKLDKIKCEMLPEDAEAVLYGDYFFDSNLKIFIGNTEIPAASIISIEKTALKFKAPAMNVTGPVTVSTSFGVSKPTVAWFNDMRGYLTGFEDSENDGTGFVAGWGRPEKIENEATYSLMGKYAKFQGEIENGSWSTGSPGMVINIWSAANTDNPNAGLSDPLFTSDPATSVLKFEINVVDSWSALPMIFCFKATNDKEGWLWADGTQPRAFWMPWQGTTEGYKTEGWETVTIPISSMIYNGSFAEVGMPTSFGELGIAIHNRGYGIDTEKKYCGIDISGSVKHTPLILIDNVRVVPQ